MPRQPLIRLIPEDRFSALIDAFCDDCALANLTPKAIRFYRTNLGRYHWWCVQTGASLDPTTHTVATVREFLRYVQTSRHRWGTSPSHNMANRPVTASTLHAYHRTLRRFYNWLVEQEFIEARDNPMGGRKVRAPKLRVEQPDPFDEEELERLVTVLRRLGHTPLGARDRAIAAILLDTGLRASELLAIQVDEIDIVSGRIWVAHGKGDKPREVRLGAAARKPVRRYWLNYRRALGERGPFIVSATHEPLSDSGLRQRFKKLGRRAGIEVCHPHRFRHTFAVNALRAGMGMMELQAILGHTSLDMVRRYVKLAETDIIRASQQHSPLDRLDLGL